MNTKTHTQTTFRRTLAIMTLLLLVFSATTPATAQLATLDEPYDLIEELERSLSNPSVRAKLTTAQWYSYGDRLADALASGHEGVQQGALRMIILYGDYMELKRTAVFDVVRIYRNHQDDRLRRMAVVALGKIQDPWGLDMLKRSARFEKSPGVGHTIQAVLAESGTIDLGPAKVGS